MNDPGTESTQPSFEDFQHQASLMTGCTLLWKELSDHFLALERNLLVKSEELMGKIRALDDDTKGELKALEEREKSIDVVVATAVEKVREREIAAHMIKHGGHGDDDVGDGEVDDGDGFLLTLRSLCTKMNSRGFWRFVITRKKEMDSIRAQMPVAISDCVDPARFVLDAISEVFPVDKRVEKSERVNDLGWACVLILESLVPLVVDPVFGKSRLLVTPKMKERAREIAEAWKASLDERGGIENVKTPDVHTFLQHLVTFGIVKKEDVGLYRKLVIASAWRKQMPKLAVSLGLGDRMPDMIEELISRGQQVDAVHFTFEVGLEDKFPPVPLLKAFLNDAKKAAGTILEDPNNSGRSAHLAARKEQSALRAVIKCIEEYKLEAEFPSDNLKKRLEQLEKTKTSEKRKPVAVPANKRTRANIGGPTMPPAKAGRSTNAYVSSFPAAPTYTRSPPYTQYPTGVPQYQSPPTMYSSNRSPPYMYSPETASPPMGSYPGIPVNYSPYGGYVNGVVPAYHQAYYR